MLGYIGQILKFVVSKLINVCCFFQKSEIFRHIGQIPKRIIYGNKPPESLEIMLSRQFPLCLSDLILEYYVEAEVEVELDEDNAKILCIYVSTPSWRNPEQRIIAGLSDGGLRIWYTNKKFRHYTLEKFWPIQRIIGVPNGDIATIAANGDLMICDKVTMQIKHTERYMINPLNLFVISRQSLILRENFHYWTYGDKYLIGTHLSPECTFVLPPVSEDFYVYNNGSDNTLIIQGNKKLILRGHTMKVNCAVSVTPGILCSGSDDKSLIVWDTMTGNKIMTLWGHTDRISCLQALDGKVYSGSDDQTIRVWDLQKRKCEYVFNGHKDPIIDIKITADKKIVSCSKKKVILWKVSLL